MFLLLTAANDQRTISLQVQPQSKMREGFKHRGQMGLQQSVLHFQKPVKVEKGESSMPVNLMPFIRYSNQSPANKSEAGAKYVKASARDFKRSAWRL